MKFGSPAPSLPTSPAPEAEIVIRPQRRVLARKIAGVAFLVVVFAVLPTVLSQLTRENARPRNYLPGFALLAGMLCLHLLFLARALFVTLNRGAEIRIRGEHLQIRLDGQSQCLAWHDIRELRFGDIHFRITTEHSTIEVPFLAPADQRLLYRLHYQRTGLTPDGGRFLAAPRRPPSL